MRIQELDAYAVLGVDPAAADGSVAAAYGPWRDGSTPTWPVTGATHQMSVVNAAFDESETPKRPAQIRRRARGDRPRPGRRGAGASARPRARPSAADPAAAGARASSRPSPYHEFDDSSGRDGTGGAGRPPGRPSGSVLTFGRHLGWSIGEIARVDPGYLVWLEERREGRPLPRRDRHDAPAHRVPRGPRPTVEEALTASR